MKYIYKIFDGVHKYEHRHVWEQNNGAIPKGMHIHHINGNHTDNRIENLALVTHKENQQKSDRWGKGWTFNRRMKTRPYQARKTVNGKMKTLGYFGTICGAIMASRMALITD